MGDHLKFIKAGSFENSDREKELRQLYLDLHKEDESESADLVQQQILSELKGIRQELKQLKWEGLFRDFRAFNTGMKIT